MEQPNPFLMSVSVPSSARQLTNELFGISVASAPPPLRGEFPLYQTPYKIAVIGSEPTNDDLKTGTPLSTTSGSFVFDTLRRIRNINRADAYVNLATTEQLGKAVKKPRSRHSTLQQTECLRADIESHNPNIILLLGQLALSVATESNNMPIGDWRGSLLRPTSGPFAGRKCLATFAPMDVFINWDNFPLFRHDLGRFCEEVDSPDLRLPVRDFDIHMSPDMSIQYLDAITDIRRPIAMDIEGGCKGMSCVSFATSPYKAFIVPFGSYGRDDQVRVLRALHRFCSSSTPKVLQNQLYDNFVLTHTYRMFIRNVVWDTMLSGWEIYPELPKGLGTQVSLWTREPYYKVDRKIALKMTKKVSSKKADDDDDSDDSVGYVAGPLNMHERDILHRYCCKDSACTLEIAARHYEYMSRDNVTSKAHFVFNRQMLSPLLYMQLRGMLYDRQQAQLLTTEFGNEILRLQTAIDEHIQNVWRKHGCRGDQPKSLNVDSPKQLVELLYVSLGYPKQHPKKGREVDTTKLTANVDALLELRKRYNGPSDAILEHILQYRKYTKLQQAANLTVDPDGRIRCSYNLVGTETGRLGCRKSATGSGANLTTITKSLRKLYVADPECWFFQCDLSGADGWTVAAHCALQGDSTMLDDYMAGIKPAKVIVLMLKGVAVQWMPREEIIAACKTVSEDGPDGWMYFTAKQVQHGSNYGLGKDKMSRLVLLQSYKRMGKTIIVSPSECQRMQDLYLSRYRGVRMWQQHIKHTLDTTASLPCASGHTRTFFGRRCDHATHAAGFSHEPQANTTYATNLALYRLWTDRDNRIVVDGRTRLRVEPLHHVHDALCGQFRRSDTEFALPKIRSWFDNTLVIAGREIVIPFEGEYGPSWGALGEKYGGGRI